MRSEWIGRIGLSATLLSILVALGIFLFAQEQPPSEGGYGGTGTFIYFHNPSCYFSKRQNNRCKS